MSINQLRKLNTFNPAEKRGGSFGGHFAVDTRPITASQWD
jgi:hypothetical protein